MTSTLLSASGSALASAHTRWKGFHQPAWRLACCSMGSARSSAITCAFGQRFFISALA